jgi:hypothetical protein
MCATMQNVGGRDARRLAILAREALIYKELISMGGKNPSCSALNVSFSIFQRARPHAANSATLLWPIARSVMKLLR